MLLSAAALLASIVIGPEITPPAELTTPASGYNAVVSRLDNGNFVVAWESPSPILETQVIDRDSGTPVRKVATPIPKGRQGFAAAALGNHVLAAWYDAGRLRWALLDDNGQAVTTGNTDIAVSYTRSISMTAIGNRYLVVWQSPDFTINGIFIDTDGRAAGSSFPVFRESADGGFALASDGTRALIAVAGVKEIVTETIDSGGRVTRAGSMPSPYAGSVRAAWDGDGFALAWLDQSSYPAYNSDLWLGWTDAEGHPRGAPFKYAKAYLAPTLVATTPGVTMFLQQPDKTNVFVRFGMGGSVRDPFPRPLPVAFEPSYFGVDSATFDGRRYYVVSHTSGATTDLVTPSTAAPMAFTAASVWQVRAAVGEHQSFIATERDIVRFRDGTFSGTAADLHSIPGLVADGDGVAAVDWDRMQFFDAGGQLVSSFALPQATDGSSKYRILSAARLPNGNFLAATEWRNYDQYTIWASLFDRTRVLSNRAFVPYIPITPAFALSGTSGAIAWVDDRGRSWIGRIDGNGMRLGIALQLGPAVHPNVSEIAMADDGRGHALVATTTEWGAVDALWLVDLATMRVERKSEVSWPSQPQLVWTGDEYLFASGNLAVATISANGVPTGNPELLPEPYGAYGVQLASGPAGTLIVYIRIAADLGYGNADRPFVREVKAARRRAAGK